MIKRWLMERVNKHERCIGFRLFSDDTRFVQLWYCPAGYEIKPHSHDKENIELMFIYGSTTFFRRAKDFRIQQFTPRWFHCFKSFSVPAGTSHWFKVNSKPLIFINFSQFIDGEKPVSAANDFNLS